MTNDQLNRILYIAPYIKKHINGTLTVKEQEVLDSWIAESSKNRELFNKIILLDDIEEFNKTYLSVDTVSALDSLKQRHSFEGKSRKLYRWLPYAAAAVLFVSMIVLWKNYDQKPQSITSNINFESQDIPPGANRATLTLSSGESISLSETQSGIIINEQNISYQGSKGQVVDLSSGKNNLVLHTPKGGTYSVTLSDGTKVWLNAQSTLKYPSSFDEKERVVELIGEGYFEVSKVDGKKKWPFKVISKNQRVEVLGTQFNITAYPDQSEIKTTLVEGSVRLAPFAKGKSPAVILEPGQQGVLDQSTLVIDVKPVDVESYTAWKDGFFYFHSTPIAELMEQVARWYNVDVFYNKGVPKETFSGKIRRNTSLKGFLEILQISNIDVKLRDNKLIIN